MYSSLALRKKEKYKSSSGKKTREGGGCVLAVLLLLTAAAISQLLLNSYKVSISEKAILVKAKTKTTERKGKNRRCAPLPPQPPKEFYEACRMPP